MLYINLSSYQIHASERPPTGSLTIQISQDGSVWEDGEFILYQVDESATRPSSASEAEGLLLSDTMRTASFDSSGRAVFTELRAGLYYVRYNYESRPEDIDTVEPFLVDVPWLDDTGEAWKSDVTVYVKSSALYIDKFVRASGEADRSITDVKKSKKYPAKKGEAFGWTILSYVPRSVSTLNGSYVITDVQEDAFIYDTGSLKVYYAPQQDSVAHDSVLLQAGVDYQAVMTGGELKITLLSEGMLKAAEDSNRYILAKWDSILSENAAYGVDLYSDASVTYTALSAARLMAATDAVTETDMATATETVMATAAEERVSFAEVAYPPGVHYGQVAVAKYSAADRTLGLSGARFGIADSRENAESGVFLLTAVTDEDGMCYFKGLSYGEEGDLAAEDSAGTEYWIYEIEAPEGYQAPNTAYRVEFHPVTLGDEDGEIYFALLTVYNAKRITVTPTRVPTDATDPGGSTPGTSTPDTTTTPRTTTGTKTSVSTGDNTRIFGYIFLGIGAVLLLPLIIRKSRALTDRKRKGR